MVFVPCSHCYLKHGEQYTQECDDFCDYAKVCLENKELKDREEERKQTSETLCCFLTEMYNKYSEGKCRGFVKIDDLKCLAALVKKLMI